MCKDIQYEGESYFGMSYLKPNYGNISDASEFDNVSYTNEQYDEAVIRLFIHFADLKIDNLIDLFEKNNQKDFSVLKQVEDLKKKKEIYQNTIWFIVLLICYPR